MKKVIVDTSIWIDFFRGSLLEREKDFFIGLLENEKVAITEIIHHELLIGSKSQTEFVKLNALLEPYEVLSLCSYSQKEFNIFGYSVLKKGLVGKFTDLSIAFLSDKTQNPVWSKDKYFYKLNEKKIIAVISIH